MLFAAPGCTRGGGAGAVKSDAASFIPVDPASTSATDKAIAAAQARLKVEPSNAKARLALAQAFLQKVRETADPSLYGKADQLLRGLAKETPKDPGVLIARGTLALARHRFSDGLAIGKAALAAAPDSEAALGVIVDASNELGKYDEALTATQRMVDTKPNLASLSRVSYARELHGDLPGAIDAMSKAATAVGGTSGENAAYVQTQLGILLVTSGDLEGAAAAFAAADTAFPAFVPAKVGRARLYLAQGRNGDAAAALADAARVQPLSDTVALLGDALEATGDTAGATQAFDLVGVIARLYKANGVKVDLEMALFDADHHPGRDAIAGARRALADRPSIFGHDVLAWNLYRAGKVQDAWKEEQKALVIGSRDPQLQFHAATIALAAGHRDDANTHLGALLETNPRFSPRHAREIADLRASLGT